MLTEKQKNQKIRLQNAAMMKRYENRTFWNNKEVFLENR